MAIHQKKLLECFVLYCFIQIITARELNPSTQEKITELVGEKQISLRNYLEGVKLEVLRIDNDIATALRRLENSTKNEIDNIFSKIKSNAENESKSTNCTTQMNQGIQEISKQLEDTLDNCDPSLKSSSKEIFHDITKHAEFQIKIGSSPRNCMDSNNNLDSIIKCLEKSMGDIGKQMKNSEDQLNSKIEQLKKHINNNMVDLLHECETKLVSEIIEKSKVITKKIDECAEL